VAVPLVLATKVTPVGNAPVTLKVAFGTDFRVLTVNVLTAPTTNVALFTLTILGGRVMVSVKFCVAAGLTPFDAVSVRG
jgi:hypothetical protein